MEFRWHIAWSQLMFSHSPHIDSNREEIDIRRMLDIHDTTIPESKLREFEREVSEGFILCDVEVIT